jgi:hypothetical protein
VDRAIVDRSTVTKREFAALKPRQRGYAVYMLGAREDQPNVPDESNPYPDGSRKHKEWAAGADAAALFAQDNEED